MQDIVKRIGDKGRKFKITTKVKFVQDGLISSASARMSSVYVIVITDYTKFFSSKNGKQEISHERKEVSNETD